MVLKFPVASPGRQVEKRMFPYRKPTAYITLPCATALACDTNLIQKLQSLSSIVIVKWHASLLIENSKYFLFNVPTLQELCTILRLYITFIYSFR